MRPIRSCLQLAAILAFVLATGCASAQPSSAILYIGDGMGVAQVTAARIYKSNARDGKLALDGLEHVALVRTHAANAMVTDSAAAATALATGHKADLGAISIDPEGRRLATVLELAKARGKSVGIVTTTRVTHATPACFYSHVASRNDEAEIARQFIDYGRVDLLLGGGKEFFMTAEQRDPERRRSGLRQDGRDLIAEARTAGYRLIERQSEFDAVAREVAEGEGPDKLLGLFNRSMMEFEIDRERDRWGEPSLAEMTRLAIAILSRNPRGYFLMVEGGRIDHACHDNRALAAMEEMLAFDEAVAVGLEAGGVDTLIVVTADHETGGLAINGYASIEVGGRALMTESSAVYQSDLLTFATGPGADRAPMADRPRDNPRYRQPALIQLGSATHTGVDVLAWATGPGAEAVGGTMQNSEVGRAIIEALGLEEEQ